MTVRVNAKSPGFRGQPLLMLGLLVVGWTGLRYVTWASHLPEDFAGTASAAEAGAEAHQGLTVSPDIRRSIIRPPEASAGGEGNAAPAPALAPARPSIDMPPAPRDGGWNDPHYYEGAYSAVRQPVAGDGKDAKPASPMRMAAGHTLLAAAGFSNMELPPEIAAFLAREMQGREARGKEQSNPLLAAARVPDAAPLPVAPLAAAREGDSRWSADGWLLWRDDTTTPFTSGRPSYGRSQLGAVVRYELAPSSGHRPQAYLRGSAALQGASEQEVAAGLSARPITSIPIRVAAEVRVSERALSTEVRPAAYAVTELPPQELPGGLQAQAYVQAGYVGGDFATPFVDGQARVDRSLASVGDFDLRAGAAAWGGAQDDGERLDIGPTASVTFRLGDTRGRVAADYRFRVAGDAEPASGPALTLSAGF